MRVPDEVISNLKLALEKFITEEESQHNYKTKISKIARELQDSVTDTDDIDALKKKLDKILDSALLKSRGTGQIITQDNRKKYLTDPQEKLRDIITKTLQQLGFEPPADSPQHNHNQLFKPTNVKREDHHCPAGKKHTR